MNVPKNLPKRYHDHWRRPWLRKARNSLGFRRWLGRHGYLSPHFTKASAGSKDGRPIPRWMIPRARNHAFRLEVLRHKLGDKPVSPLSWYRSPQHNVAVGGASKSKHMQAIATDHPNAWVDANGGQERLKSLGEQVGFNGVGVYPAGSMHFDSRRGSFTWWRSF